MLKFQFIILLTSFFALMSCSENAGSENPETPETNNTSSMPFDKRAFLEVKRYLAIPNDEEFKLKIYHEHLNSDTILDAIIAVNRLEYAMNEAIKNGREAKAAELGFNGNYNYLFYYDGALDKISNPIFVPSSPGRELDIAFRSICSPIRKDILVTSRVRNSGWIAYYSVFNEHDLMKVFEWKWFDKLGDKTPEALVHEFVENPDNIAQDIEIYESEIDQYKLPIEDIYTYVPSITKKKKLILRFLLDPKEKKYRLYPEFKGNLPQL